jgi:hypothetical protein
MIEQKTIDELFSYADLDGTEWGGAMINLINLYRTGGSVLNFELLQKIEDEMRSQLAAIKGQCIIVEETETITRKVKRLEDL